MNEDGRNGTPNQIAIERGITIGSTVRTAVGRYFVVESLDEDGDPYGGPGHGAHAYNCRVVPPRPNCDLLAATKKERADLVRFLDWLEDYGVELRAVHSAMDGDHSELLQSHEELVQTYVGIDHKALEEERRALVESL